MKRLIFSPRAAIDIDEIWDYSARRWDIDQAESYIGTLREACSALARGEQAGRDIGNVRPGYLRISAASHYIFYRHVSGNNIEIVRILHQRMDFARHL